MDTMLIDKTDGTKIAASVTINEESHVLEMNIILTPFNVMALIGLFDRVSGSNLLRMKLNGFSHKPEQQIKAVLQHYEVDIIRLDSSPVGSLTPRLDLTVRMPKYMDAIYKDHSKQISQLVRQWTKLADEQYANSRADDLNEQRLAKYQLHGRRMFSGNFALFVFIASIAATGAIAMHFASKYF
jgi:hypothetical protein